MSVEFKCDRCGEPIPPGDVSRTSGNFTIWRDGEESTFDLCKDCLDKLDIFMTGEMPKPEYKPELTYIQLPNPKVFALRKGSWVTSNEYELHICGDLEPLEKLLIECGGSELNVKSVETVILGVDLA